MIKNILNLGDAALYCDFGKEVNEEINSYVISYFNYLTKLVREGKPGEINQALMDMGNNICKSNKVICLNCPFNSSCEAFLSGNPLSYPKKIRPKKSSQKNFRFEKKSPKNV